MFELDGKEALYQLSERLGENQDAAWVDDRTSYQFLWEGAKRYVARTNDLTAYQDITTVADQTNYTFDAKFMKLYLRDKSNRYYIRYRATILTGTADATEANKLHDADGGFAASNVGNTVWNTIDDTYTTVSAYVDTGELTLTDDIMADTEVYILYSSDNFLTWKDYEDIIYANKITASDAVDIPSHFSIKDKQSLYSQITGTATSTTADAGGECILTDTEALFTTTDYVSPGDTIHNTTDDSDGIVLSVTSATALVCALFGGDNDWTTADTYVIQPQGRLELILYPPPDDATDTVRVWYIERPDPVFSDYGIYRFGQQAMEAILDYAAGKYKYRDNDPEFAREFLANWDLKIRRDNVNLRPMIKKRGFSINYKKRR